MVDSLQNSLNPEALNHLINYLWAQVGLVIIAGGGGATVAWGIFRTFGKSWLQHHFRKELETIRTEGKKEIELLRHTINSEYSRISKIHEKEFEVLPKAWKLLHHSYGSAQGMTQRLKRYPNLDNMTAQDFVNFVAESTLPEHIKKGLIDAPDRLKYYQDYAAAEEYRKAKSDQNALNNYLYLNSIFMTQELKTWFLEMNKSIHHALISWEIGTAASDYKMIGESSEEISKLATKFDDIEKAVQQRLQYQKA